MGHHCHKVNRVPIDTPMVPCMEGSPPSFPGRRPSFMMSVDKERYAQVVSTLGGAILGSRGNPTQDILTPSNRWRDLPQYLEYRAAKEVLSLVFSFLLLCPFLSPPFFRHKEDNEKATTGMPVDMGVHKVTWLFSRPHNVKTKVVRPQTFAECSKGHCIRLHTSLTPRIPCPLQRGILPPYPKWVS
jgi:hypothetical protein